MRTILEDIKDTFWSSERRSDLLQVAQKRGYQFKNSRSFLTLDLELKAFDFFGEGKNHKIKYILSQSVERLSGNVELFDFHRDGQQKVTTLVLIQSVLLELPKFKIEKRSKWDWIKRKSKGRAIEFMGFPEFNDLFHLYTDAPARRMKDLFQEEFLDFLVEHPDCFLEAHQEFLILGRKEEQIDARDIPTWMEAGRMIGLSLFKGT
ncbi:MAG: hypothetical protein AAGG68_11075 [Bacteroidota bacterium]